MGNRWVVSSKPHFEPREGADGGRGFGAHKSFTCHVDCRVCLGLWAVPPSLRAGRTLPFLALGSEAAACVIPGCAGLGLEHVPEPPIGYVPMKRPFCLVCFLNLMSEVELLPFFCRLEIFLFAAVFAVLGSLDRDSMRC